MPVKKQSTKNQQRKKKIKDAEISAEQVVREEVFPSKSRERKNKSDEHCGCGCGCGKSHAQEKKSKRKKAESAAENIIESKCGCGCDRNPSEPKKNAAAHKCAGRAPAKKKPTNGERPKQRGYRMIDRSDESADGGKS